MDSRSADQQRGLAHSRPFPCEPPKQGRGWAVAKGTLWGIAWAVFGLVFGAVAAWRYGQHLAAALGIDVLHLLAGGGAIGALVGCGAGVVASRLPEAASPQKPSPGDVAAAVAYTTLTGSIVFFCLVAFSLPEGWIAGMIAGIAAGVTGAVVGVVGMKVSPNIRGKVNGGMLAGVIGAVSGAISGTLIRGMEAATFLAWM